MITQFPRHSTSPATLLLRAPVTPGSVRLQTDHRRVVLRVYRIITLGEVAFVQTLEPRAPSLWVVYISALFFAFHLAATLSFLPTTSSLPVNNSSPPNCDTKVPFLLVATSTFFQPIHAAISVLALCRTILAVRTVFLFEQSRSVRSSTAKVVFSTRNPLPRGILS